MSQIFSPGSPSYLVMAGNQDQFKPCNVCTRACYMTHGHQVQAEMMLVYGAPSFFQLISADQLQETSFLPVPTRFLIDYGNRLRNVVTWRGPSGWVGNVNLSYEFPGYGFREGWKEFQYYHNIEPGDHLVCTMIADSDFVVKIYDKQGCEKSMPLLNPNNKFVTSAVEKSNGNQSSFPGLSLNQSIDMGPPKLGEKRGVSMNEDHPPFGIQKKHCTQQQPTYGGSGAGNGTVDTSVENEKRKLPETEVVVHSSDDDSPVDMEGGRNPLPENSSRLESEKEDSDTPSNEAEIRRAIYEAQVTNPLSTALKAAREYKTSNPSTICVVNKTAASKSQSYISTKFARKWLPAVKTQLLLVDEHDRKWPVIFIPKSYHVVLSAGWAKFVRDNSLESGDVVLMELMGPNSLSLVIHIFREGNRTVENPVSNTVDNAPQPSPLSTGQQMENPRDERMNGDHITGTSRVDTANPIPPQYSAAANYFSSRISPGSNSNHKDVAANSSAAEAEKATEGAEVQRESGKTSASEQGGPSTTEAFPERVAPERSSRIAFFKQHAFQGAPIPVPDISYPPSFPNFRPILPVPPVPPLMPQQVLMPNFTPTQMGGNLDPRAHNMQHVDPRAHNMQQVDPRAQNMQQASARQPLHQKRDPAKASLPSEVAHEAEPPPHDEQVLRPQDKWEVQPRRAREPTDIEKRRAMDRALEFWTPNPHVISLLKPSQVYNGFSINLRSPALPNETKDATLLDSEGKSWICKWLVNASGKRLSAGWKRFALDHDLEEYDVCVFEVLSRDNLTMVVHIFRVELDDSTLGAEEIKPIIPPPAKKKRIRIRKSRAKVQGLPSPLIPSDFIRKPEKQPDMSTPTPAPGINVPSTTSYHKPPNSHPAYPSLQSQRRPVTMVERKRTELAARSLSTANPSVVVVLTRSSVYCHFTVSIPSAFAKQWLPKKLVGVSLLDSAGQRSTARWAGNRKSSACLKGFKAFSLSHRLEEGDTLVFELMDANPDNLVFLIHVFRVVELSNNAFIPQEVDNDASHLLTDSEDDSDDSSLQSPTKTKSKQKTPAAYGENGGPPLVGKGFCADVLPLAVRMPKPEPFYPFPVAGESPTHEGNQ